MKTLVGAAEPNPRPEPSHWSWLTPTTGTATWPPPGVIAFGQAFASRFPPIPGTATAATTTWMQLDWKIGR